MSLFPEPVTNIKLAINKQLLSYYYLTVYSVVHLCISIFVALTFRRNRNCHRNTIVTEQNRTSRKQTSFFRTITTGGSVITGGMAKEMQLLPVPVVLPSVVFSNQG